MPPSIAAPARERSWLQVQLTRLSAAVRHREEHGGAFAQARDTGAVKILEGELGADRFRKAGWRSSWIVPRRKGANATYGHCVETSIRDAIRRRHGFRTARQALLYLVWLAVEIDRLEKEHFGDWAELGVIGEDYIFRSADQWAYRRMPDSGAVPSLHKMGTQERDRLRDWLALVAPQRPLPILGRRLKETWTGFSEGGWCLAGGKTDAPAVRLEELMHRRVTVLAVSRARSGGEGGFFGFVGELEWTGLRHIHGGLFRMDRLVDDPASVEPVARFVAGLEDAIVTPARVLDWEEMEPK